MAGCGPRRVPQAYRARDGGAGESVLGREAGREGQGGTDSDHGETSGREARGCVSSGLRPKPCLWGSGPWGPPSLGSGKLSPPSVLFESFSARTPPISLAHPSHQELEFAPKVQSCSQDEGRGLDFRSPWHPGDLRGVPRPPQTFPSKTKDVTSNPGCGGHKISQAPEQSRIL